MGYVLRNLRGECLHILEFLFRPKVSKKSHFNFLAIDFPNPALYSLGIAKSMVNSAYLALEIDGTIKLGGKTIKLAKAPGEQGHMWGKKHAQDKAKLENSLKGKAKSDGEDVLTPLIQQAANSILTDVTKK